MTVSSVSSTTNPYYQSVNQTSFKQRQQDLQALSSALQSNDLTSAQTAFATLQQNVQGTTQTSQTSQTNQPFGQNTQANTDYQSLQSALQSNDLAGAQKAFSSLTQDLQSGAGQVRGHHHHHHHGGNANAASTGSSNSGSTPSSSTPSATANPLLAVTAQSDVSNLDAVA